VSILLGTVHKRRPQSGEFVQCGHFADKEFLQMRTSARFGAKNFRFFEVYGVSARTRVEGSWTSADKERKSIFCFFAILCWHLLWTAPCSSLPFLQFVGSSLFANFTFWTLPLRLLSLILSAVVISQVRTYVSKNCYALDIFST